MPNFVRSLDQALRLGLQLTQELSHVLVNGSSSEHSLSDMADWWQPAAANHFARIKKDQILQAIQEATGAPIKERLRSLKKQDPATEAEKSVTGTRWLPELLRK